VTRTDSGHREKRRTPDQIPGAEILTVTEVAQTLRCSKAHVHNLINGKVSGVLPLPTIPLGRRRIIRRTSLDRWAKDNERTFGGDMLPSSPEVDAVDA
jgi:excisionase family DNA binding protein